MNSIFNRLFRYGNNNKDYQEHYDSFSKELLELYFKEYPHITVSDSLDIQLMDALERYLQLTEHQRLLIKVPFYLKKYCLLKLYLIFTKYFNVTPNQLELNIDIGEHMSGECLIMEII